jgi:hypothetical protein
MQYEREAWMLIHSGSNIPVPSSEIEGGLILFNEQAALDAARNMNETYGLNCVPIRFQMQFSVPIETL